MSVHDAAEVPWGDGDAAADADADGEATPHDLADAADSFDEVSPPLRPFENLPNLPADLREAFDSFKLAIVHHRLAQWQEVSQADVLVTLDALRQFALAPAEV